MKLIKYYLNFNSYWRVDNDTILIINEICTLRLNQRSGFLFINMVIKQNLDNEFYRNAGVDELEVTDFIDLLLSKKIITTTQNATINKVPHVNC